jgi:predicted alpha/beta superfamily hydrolase
MKKIIFFATILYSFSAFAQKDNRIVIGTADTVYSNILKEKRIVYAHIPKGDKNERFPVLYILDGEEHFQSAVAIDDQMSGVIHPMIVVGITNTDRERDLTPTHISPDRMVNPGDAKKSGGGKNFISFLEKELIPYVDAKYPTTSYKLLSGHSLGGLTVVNAFINHSNIFNAYIAIDPSLWWDSGKWITEAEKKLTNANLVNKSLYIAVANNFAPKFDTLSVLKDTSINTLFPRSVFGFVHFLQNEKPNGLSWRYKFYTTERHGTVELVAEYDALRSIFDYYSFSTRPFMDHQELSFTKALTDHYKLVSQKLGYTVDPTEGQVNEFAYSCMGQGRWKDAYILFKMNTEKHPTSANAFDSLGDYYSARGDKQHAIEAYTKSLSLQETEDTRRKLNELKK